MQIYVRQGSLQLVDTKKTNDIYNSVNDASLFLC